MKALQKTLRALHRSLSRSMLFCMSVMILGEIVSWAMGWGELSLLSLMGTALFGSFLGWIIFEIKRESPIRK